MLHLSSEDLKAIEGVVERVVDKKLDQRFTAFEYKIDRKLDLRFADFEKKIDSRFIEIEKRFHQKLIQMERRLKRYVDGRIVKYSNVIIDYS